MAQFDTVVDNKTLESAGWGIINRANKVRQNGKEKHAARLHTLGRQMVEEARADGELDLKVRADFEEEFGDSILAVQEE